MLSTSAQPPSPTQLRNTIVIAGLNYLRWTQILPMIVVWVFYLLVTIALLLSNFESAMGSVMDSLHAFTALVPGLSAWLEQVMNDTGAASTDGSINITDDWVMGNVWAFWAGASWILMVIDWILGLIRGERSPVPGFSKTRKRCTNICIGVAAVLALTVLIGDKMGGPDNQTMFLWMIAGGTLIVWLVSTYSLGVSNVIAGIIQSIQSRGASG